MRTRTARQDTGCAQALAYGVFVGIALILMAWPAGARPETTSSAGPAAQQQWQLVHQMTQTTMLAALGFSSERVVRSIEEARDTFSQNLRDLHGDDAEVSLIAARPSDTMSPIARIRTVWPLYDAVLQTVIDELRTAPMVDDSHIQELSEIHTLLIEAIDLVDAAEQ